MNCTFWIKPLCKATRWLNCIEVYYRITILLYYIILLYYRTTISYNKNSFFQYFAGKLSSLFFSGSLLTALILFLLVPLVSPNLDVVLPLNETRPRQQLLKINYIIFDDADYFFYVYMQLAWGSIMVVVTIISVDSLYILIIHHNSGLFAVCG